ncbi:MAG: copper resistance CopC/CopD family protein [Dermatophilaceae bacterium]
MTSTRTLARRFSLLSLVLASALIAMLMTAAPAQAHASLLSTDPVADALYDEGPGSVSLRFSEPVGIELGGVRVFGPDGQRVDSGVSRQIDGGETISADLDARAMGTYTVAWSVVSADSHVLSGTFLFHFGGRSGAADVGTEAAAEVGVARWLARWSLLAGTTLLGGLAVFRAATGTRVSLHRGRASQLALAASALLVIGAALKLVGHVADASGRTLLGALPLLGEAVVGTRAGTLDGMRLLVAGGALTAALLWRRRFAVPLALVSVLVVMVTLALGGHAWTSSVPALTVAVDVVHHAAAAVWIGGVAALGFAITPRGENAGEDTVWAVRRFSVMALVAIVAVSVTGLVSALHQSGMAPSTLLSTRYGVTLMVKLALVALVVGLGWWQRSRLLAAVSASSRLFSVARGEVAVAATILAVTALLVDTVPAREALAPQPFETTVAEDAGSAAVLVTPAMVGDNAVYITFFDRVGSPRGVDVAVATVTQGDLPPRSIELTPLASSHWVAPQTSLPSPGTWTVTVDTLGRGTQSQVTFEVEISEETGD